jgi:hypothetical protein
MSIRLLTVPARIRDELVEMEAIKAMGSHEAVIRSSWALVTTVVSLTS